VRVWWVGRVFARNLAQFRSERVVPDRTFTATLRHRTGRGTYGGVRMRMRYLGKTAGSKDDNCDALYATDRGTFGVQGKVVTDPEALADARDLTDEERIVEVQPDVLKLAERA